MSDKSDEISAELEKLTVGSYSPQAATEMLVPKSTKSFRIAHQLTAMDSLIYLASVLENAPSFESVRVSSDEEVAFSYRFLEGEGPRVFRIDGSFHDWLIKLKEYGGESTATDKRMVVETDISDFYQRIYFHRVENALASGTQPKSAQYTKKLIKSIRANQSFGIPVGQTASRIIAEVILNDTDQFLIEEGVAHTRYVDDFRIIVENSEVAHATLCKLAEHLMVTEGLSLNGEKTHFLPIASMHQQASSRIDDILNNVDIKKFEKFLRIEYEEDVTLDEKEDDAASLIFFDANDLVKRILKMEEYGGKDISTFKALMRAIRVVGNVDPALLMKLDDRYLYLIPREFCLAYSVLAVGDASQMGAVREKLLWLLNAIPFRDLTICRYWILDLFVKGAIPFSWNDFRDYDFTKSSVERRCEFLLRGRLGQTAYFRARKTQFGQLNNWEKTAFLMGAMSLPRDEYERWLTAVSDQIPGPGERLFCDWLRENHGQLVSLLNY